jgi:hypothetical protein
MPSRIVTTTGRSALTIVVTIVGGPPLAGLILSGNGFLADFTQHSSSNNTWDQLQELAFQTAGDIGEAWDERVGSNAVPPYVLMPCR